MSSLSRLRWHIVTGKGGVGKTTTAAALAMTLATGGRRVFLAEVEQRLGLAPLFGVKGVGYSPQLVATTPNGGEVFAANLDPEAALVEYLELYYKLGRAAKPLRRIGAIDFVTSIAPGLRDLLLLGKVSEAVTPKEADAPQYDAVVLDAPPTGRIGKFLNVADEVADLVRVGPIQRQGERVTSALRASTTGVHLVTLLEHLSVQETHEAAAELNQIGVPVGAIIINRTTNDGQLPTRISMAELGRGLIAAGLPAGRSHTRALAAEAREHVSRQSSEQDLRRSLQALSHPIVDLPLVTPELTAASLPILTAAVAQAWQSDGPDEQ